MARGFYDLRDGGPADRALPVMVRRLRNTGDLAQDTSEQLNQMRATVARAERETQEVMNDFHIRQTIWEDLLPAIERQVARLQSTSTSSAPPPDASQSTPDQ